MTPGAARAQPDAFFTTSELFSCLPTHVVTFTNESNPGGGPGSTSYLWEFGDGTMSLLETPLPHLYTPQPGGYTVTLTVTTGLESDMHVVSEVAVPAVATPSFTQDVSAGCGDVRVCFTDTSDANVPLTSYFWDFGDGNTSGQRNTCHTYTAPGLYDVEFTVTNLCGDTTTTETNAVVVVAPTDPPQSAAHCADPQCIMGAPGDLTCVAATCEDGVVNGDETDTDCGGSCDECPVGEVCLDDDDCRSDVCGSNGFCAVPNCFDGRKNGEETDIDCGGGDCTRCEAGNGCDENGDCASRVCEDDLCSAPECDDGTQNGDETGVDCGGSCDGCSNGQGCLGAEDCESGLCNVNVCVDSSCVDGAQGGDETDVDCGGTCGPCLTGKDCLANDDCLSGVCTPDPAGGSLVGHCAEPSCGDRVMNGDESDVDCGGSCEGCDNGSVCAVGIDCGSGFCRADLCRRPTCDDGERNGDESGVDCGGSCPSCAAGDPCLGDIDCRSGVCEGTVCAAPTCDDSTRNGDELSVDCGGSCEDCPVCVDDRDCVTGAAPVCDGSLAVCVGCVVDGDCATSEVCLGGACTTSSRPSEPVSFSGGGGCSVRPAPGAPLAAFMLLLALGIARRRR